MQIKSYISRCLQRGSSKEKEMSDEIALHVEHRTAENMARGMDPDAARRAALAGFGGIDKIKELCREQRPFERSFSFVRLFVFAMRRLAKRPSFFFFAAGTLGICVGLNLIVFSVLDAALIRSLPFVHPERLVVVFKSYPGGAVPRAMTSIANYYDWRRNISTFESVAIYKEARASLTLGDRTELVESLRISSEFFDLLGVSPALGRWFKDDDLDVTSQQCVILSHGFWQTHLGGASEVVGKYIRIDEVPHMVIGIVPATFWFLGEKPSIFLPIAHPPSERESVRAHANGLKMLAKLQVGVTAADASAELNAHEHASISDNPLMQRLGYQCHVSPLQKDYAAHSARVVVLVQAGCSLLLAMCLLSLMNLFLVRAKSRAHEFSVRRALGASNKHISLEIISEAALVATAAFAAGIVIAIWATGAMRVAAENHLPFGVMIAVDVRLVLLSVGGAVLTALILSAPGLFVARTPDLAIASRSQNRSGSISRRLHLIHQCLIMTQIAGAFILLTAATLLTVSLREVLKQPLGFESERLVTAQLTITGARYQHNQARVSLILEILDAIGELPGIGAVGISSALPFKDLGLNRGIAVEGAADNDLPLRAHSIVGIVGGHFESMSIPLLAGRPVQARDNLRTERVCVVDEAFARQYWPNDDPIGRRLSLANSFSESDAFTVVGVARTIRASPDVAATAGGAVYVPYSHISSTDLYLTIRTNVPIEAVGPMLQAVVSSKDPFLPVYGLTRMSSHVDQAYAVRRAAGVSSVFFSGAALLLAGIGTFGVLSYTVSQRRKELAVRIALGASPAAIWKQFSLFSLRLLSVGLLAGSIGAYFIARLMQSRFEDIEPFRFGVMAAPLVLVCGTVIVCCSLPAAKAARTDVIEWLNTD